MSKIGRIAFAVLAGAVCAATYAPAARAHDGDALSATVSMPLTVIVSEPPASVDVNGVVISTRAGSAVVITASVNREPPSRVAAIHPSEFAPYRRVKAAAFHFRLLLPLGTNVVRVCFTQRGSDRDPSFCERRTVVVSRYLITDLGPLGNAGEIGARGVNNRGEVVGSFLATSDIHHAFLYSGGVQTDLGTLGGSTSVAFAINALGHVVGGAEVSTGGNHAFLYAAGQMQDLGTLGGSVSAAYAINDRDEVVGYSILAGDQEFHPFLYAGGQMIDLGSLGGNGIARGINNLGQVVGLSFEPGNLNFRAFLYQNGVMTDLGTLGGVFSSAYAINNRGEIVGVADPGDGTAHAFLYSNGTMADLGTFGYTGSNAYAINDVGEIVGTVRQVSGEPLAFLFDRGEAVLLNSLLPADSGWNLTGAFGINNSGVIVGIGTHNGELRAYSLTPPP